MNAYGELKGGVYQITFDISQMMEAINGVYNMKLMLSDSRASNSIEWDIGLINIWFKEGVQEGSNNGVLETRTPDKEIWNIFEPE